MNFLFVLMEIPKRFQMPSHFFEGIGTMSAMLKQDGVNTGLLCVGDISPEEINQKLNDFEPDLIGISSMSCFAYKIPEVICHIRKRFKGSIILGGVHATVAPEKAIDIPGLSGIVIGDGELPLLEFVNCMKHNRNHKQINSFWFREEGKIIRNPIRDKAGDLDSFPFSDRELFDYNSLLIENPVAEFMCSRGCPFQCSYCVNTELNKMYNGKGKSVRYRSIEHIITEIKEVASKYARMKQIEFHDDTFTLRKEWLKEFCKTYKREIGLPFACNVRPGTIDDETPLLLKEANCIEVRIGIEAGNDFIRNNILKRNLSKGNIIKDFKKFKDVGIRTWAFNMIGIPYETVSMIEETIHLNKLVSPDFAQVSVFVPYPGTETLRICEEKGWLTDRITETYFQNESPLDLPTLTVKQIAYYNRIFRWRVMYPKMSPLIDLLCRIPIGKNKVVYDLIFPLIKKFYRFIKYRRDVSMRNSNIQS